MVDFHNTLMGKKFYDYTMPEIGKQLKRIADQMEKGANAQNVLSESERTKEDIMTVLIRIDEIGTGSPKVVKAVKRLAKLVEKPEIRLARGD